MLSLIKWHIKRLQTAITSHPSQVPNADSTVPNSESWLSGHRAKNTEYEARYAAHKKYGPVIRIAPTEFSINCLEDPDKKTVLSNLTRWMIPIGKSPLNEGADAAFHDDFCRSMADRALVTLQSEDSNETESYPTVYGHICQNPEASKPVSAD